VRGLAETMSGQPVGVRLLPFVAPGRCRVELSLDRVRGNPVPVTNDILDDR
jgi:hypothetical protein